MVELIPPRLEKAEPKERRFYVVADSSVHLSLQQEAHLRGTDLWTLGGAVLTAWLRADCPDIFEFTPQSPSSSPSLSVTDVKEGAE